MSWLWHFWLWEIVAATWISKSSLRLVLKSQITFPNPRNGLTLKAKLRIVEKKAKTNHSRRVFTLVVLLAWVVDFQVKFPLFSNMHKLIWTQSFTNCRHRSMLWSCVMLCRFFRFSFGFTSSFSNEVVGGSILVVKSSLYLTEKKTTLNR